MIDELAPNNSNVELEENLKSSFQDMMWQILTFLEVALPHEKGDGSNEEKKYKTIRQKILRIGNNNIRELNNLFNSYIVLKVFEYKKQVSPDIKTDIMNFEAKINGGKENG